MKGITFIALCLSAVSAQANTFEVANCEPAVAFEVADCSTSNQFGLGILAKVQDCPGGVCPLPYTTFEAGPPETVYRVPLAPDHPFSFGWHQNDDGSWYEVVPQDGTPYTSVCPCCGNVKQYGVTRQNTRQIARNYSAQWTFPGDLDSHLMGAPHYVSAAELSTMTYDQKLQLHDSQHNSMGSGRSFGVFRQRSRPVGWRFRPFLRMRMGW